MTEAISKEDVGAIDELEFSRAVLVVCDYLSKPKIPKVKGPIACALHEMVSGVDEDAIKRRFDFVKNVVPKAQEAVRKAKLGETTEAEILHEKKAIAELKGVLQEFIDEALQG